MNYYIADTHFGHENVIKYDNREGSGRKFDSIFEHDETIIKNWNEKVKNGDNVYILGDFSWYNATATKEILETLNGQKFLIRGNHDRWAKDGACKKLLNAIYDYKQIRDGDETLILSHYPIMMWNGQHRGAIHLYGHVHNSDEENDYQEFIRILNERYKSRDKYFKEMVAINVGCMNIDYTPMSLEELLDMRKKNERNIIEKYAELNKTCKQYPPIQLSSIEDRGGYPQQKIVEKGDYTPGGFIEKYCL